MKKLIVALFASATALLASAKVRTTDFEDDSLGLFSGSEGGVITNYTTSSPAYFPYPCGGAGNYYCEIDADNASFASSSSLGAAFCYFDMNVQFTTRADGDSASIDNAKIAVFLNEDGKIAVLAGASAQDHTRTTYVTDTTLLNGDWARLTICKADGGFKVYINTAQLTVNGQAMVFPSLDGDVNATQVAFDGKGALDNFVARTTDPFFNTDSNYAVNIGGLGGEYYMDYSEGLADALEAGCSLSTKDTRTMDGSANFPYEIPDLASLKVFQKAITATNGNDKSYALTADIALDAPWPGIGIQNGKDLVSYDVSKIGQAEADRRDAAFETCAFKGKFDGRNHTISGFQIIGKGSNAEGLDYAGFFNSTRGATIQNLKIQYAGSLFAADTTASTKESGATFVGVAKNSTLRNLTTVAGTVSCSKGFGGIVGYLMGTTVDSCTNNVNMTSLANNKCGGIAMICQKAGCSISNCENNGTMTTTSGEHGGIVGYTDSITISDCNNTAACKMFYHHGGTVTLSGENTGNATVASYTGVATPGLNFATVDGNVATFVADNALAAGETYKVMASGATAAYEFTEAGTIAFDTALATTFVGNVTADTTTLVLAAPVTDGTVTTYVATAGAASVNDVAYATFADAVAARSSDEDVVTLLANAEITLSAGDTLKVMTGPTYTLTVHASQNVIVHDSTDGDNIITFEAVACVASITVNDVTTKYVSLQAAFDAITGRQQKVVLLDSESDGAVVPEDCMFYLIPGSFTYGEITFREGDYITSVTETQIDDVNAVLYSCTPADIVVTIGGVKTFYTMQGANDAIAAAVAGGAGSTVKFRLNGGAYVNLMAASGFEYDSDNDIYTLSAPPVAAVYNNMVLIGNYATLADAVAVADNYQTVKLLDDVTLDARVEPNAYVTIDLCGHTITRTGTSGNGSAFDVKGGYVVITNGVIDCTQDDTDIAKDGVYAITARAGATVILSDLTVRVDSECGACAYPFVNENGVGAYIDIHSGTYENLTTTPYRYKPAWTGMTVNQANKDKMGGYATSLVHISGGRFKGVDPALGDDSWDDGEGSFVMDSCMTVPEGGYYVVRDAVYVSFMLRLETTPAEVGLLSVTKILKGTTVARPAQDPSTNGYTFVGWYTRHENPDNDYIPEWDSDPFDFNTPIVRNTEIWARFEVAPAPSGIDAGQSQTVEVDTEKPQEEQAQDAIDAVTLNITVPEAVAGAVSQSDYQSYFKKVATPGTGADEGKWVVTAELDEAVVFDANSEEEAATEQSILDAALDGESATATVQAAKPGLYYSMEASNDIDFAAGEGTLEGDRTLATSETVSVEKPEQLPQGNAVFFRVRVSRTDK